MEIRRFDLYIEDEEGRKGYIEVKGVTLEERGTAYFPDAPTERGVKHIRELIEVCRNGDGSMAYFCCADEKRIEDEAQ